jgi:hypothetical protein
MEVYNRTIWTVEVKGHHIRLTTRKSWTSYSLKLLLPIRISPLEAMQSHHAGLEAIAPGVWILSVRFAICSQTKKEAILNSTFDILFLRTCRE